MRKIAKTRELAESSINIDVNPYEKSFDTFFLLNFVYASN